MPEFRGVSHVALTVTDVQRSSRFYADVLGLTEIGAHDSEEHSVRRLQHPETGLVIGLHRWGGGDRRRFDEFRVGLDHLSFAVKDRRTLEHWQDVLAERGVTYSPIADVSYGSVLVFRDPDNIQLELFVNPG